MKLRYRKSFSKDLKEIKDRDVLQRLKNLLLYLEKVERLEEIPNCKKIRGISSYYRIRIGDYRLGFRMIEDYMEIVRILHRKDIYRYFP